MKLRLIREMLGYVAVGLLSGYLFFKSETGSFISVILILSSVACALLTASTFKTLFRHRDRFDVGQTIYPHEYNVEFDEGAEFVVRSIGSNEYLCEGPDQKIVKISFGREKDWKLK